jgi:hypothetical protein
MCRQNAVVTVYDLAKALPDIATLRDRCRGLAMLGAMCDELPASAYPVLGKAPDGFHTFEPQRRPGEDIALWGNGAGDYYSIVFAGAGAFVRGFDHESPLSPWRCQPHSLWPGLVDGLPEPFSRYLTDPEFATDPELEYTTEPVLEATVCLWRPTGSDRWHTGNVEYPAEQTFVNDGEEFFEGLVRYSPQAAAEEAEEYYERELDLDVIEHVYALKPLTEAVVRKISPNLSMSEVRELVTLIGYPMA